MKLVLTDAQHFKRCVDAIAVLVEEAEFVVSDSGLSLKATDPSQISMVDFFLPKKAFKEFNIAAETKLGLDLNYLSQVMARSKAKEELLLELDEEKSRLKLTFRGTSTRNFSIPLIDISAQELPNPKIEFSAMVKLRSEVLQDALKDAALLSNHLVLGANAEKFFVKTNSSKGELNNECVKEELSALQVKEESTSMFPLDYLQNMLKAAGSNDEINLHLKSNAPVKINYKIGQAEITYFLAPRIES